jgi:hypothetical protein
VPGNQPVPKIYLKLLLSAVGIIMLTACGDTPTNTPTPSPTTTGSERKVDTILLDILVQFKLKGKEAALQYARERGVLDENNNVVFTLVVDEAINVPPLADKIKGMGGTVKATYKNYLTVFVPLDILVNYATQNEQRETFFNQLSNFRNVREIRLNPPPGN